MVALDKENKWWPRSLRRVDPRRRRYAFVLGNGDYGEKYGALDNPANDANVIATKLEDLDFKVFPYSDLTESELEEAFKAFVQVVSSSNKTDTVLIYYAGHGYEENGRNYILCTPDENDEIAGYPILTMASQLEKFASSRLLFFDACRDAFREKAVAQSLSKTRSANIPVPKINAGLTESKADYGSKVVLSFSASPGKKAFDAANENINLSPYAEALARHIDSVDLPLSYVLNRVSEDVLKATDNKQQIWTADTSGEPFFFNPSSMLFLVGNLMAFMAFATALSVAFLVTAAWAIGGTNTAVLIFSVGLLLLTFLLLIFGLAKAYNRARGARIDEDYRNGFISPWSGFNGGLLGGIISTPIIAIPYWSSWKNSEVWQVLESGCASLNVIELAPDVCPHLPSLLVEISLAGILISTLIGALSVGLSNIPNDFNVKGKSKRRMLWGSLLGGLTAGASIGPLITAYFGQLDRPFVEPSNVATGALVSVSIIAFSILNYTIGTFSIERLKRSAVASIISTLIVSAAMALALAFLYWIGFIETTFEWANEGFYNETQSMFMRLSYLAIAGLPYGIVFGSFLGLLIGLARVLSEPRAKL